MDFCEYSKSQLFFQEIISHLPGKEPKVEQNDSDRTRNFGPLCSCPQEFIPEHLQLFPIPPRPSEKPKWPLTIESNSPARSKERK